MRISFTGTRAGMSEWQKQQLRKFFESNVNSITYFVHGSCAGADVEAHRIARDTLGRNIYIIAVPSTAKTRVEVDANYTFDPKPPLERDKDIVNLGCDLLIAAPRRMYEELRSGTWHTVRYARKKKVKVEILWRD